MFRYACVLWYLCEVSAWYVRCLREVSMWDTTVTYIWVRYLHMRYLCEVSRWGCVHEVTMWGIYDVYAMYVFIYMHMYECCHLCSTCILITCRFWAFWRRDCVETFTCFSWLIHHRLLLCVSKLTSGYFGHASGYWPGCCLILMCHWLILFGLDTDAMEVAIKVIDFGQVLNMR